MVRYQAKQKKNYLPAVLISCLVLLVGGCSYALYHNNATKKQSQSIGNSTQKDTTKKTTSLDQNSTGNTGTSVDTGTTPTPSVGDPYPIVNAHYKISQLNASTYDITLYAISNSPSQYNEYIAQLKQYKQEALAYLTNRYGDISKFAINWDPPNAKTL